MNVTDRLTPEQESYYRGLIEVGRNFGPAQAAHILAELDAVRAKLDWLTERARSERGPVEITVAEDGNILIASWSDQGLRGDYGATVSDAIDSGMGTL